MAIYFFAVLKSDLTKLKKNLKHLKSKIKKPNEMETDFLHKAQVLLLVLKLVFLHYSAYYIANRLNAKFVILF